MRLYTSHNDVAPPYRYLKGQAMTLIDVSLNRHDLVTIYDITEHILASNSAEEGLVNSSIS